MSANLNAFARVHLTITREGDITPLIEQAVKYKAAGGDLQLVLEQGAGAYKEFAQAVEEAREAGLDVQAVLRGTSEDATQAATSLAQLTAQLQKASSEAEKTKKKFQEFRVATDVSSDLNQLYLELGGLSVAGYETGIQLSQTGNDFQALADQAIAASDQTDKLSVSLRVTGQDVQGLAQYIDALNQAGIENIKVSMDLTEQQQAMSYSTRRLMFDLRMMSYAARTLSREFAEGSETVEEITNALVMFSAVGTGVVATTSVIKGAAAGIAGFKAAVVAGTAEIAGLTVTVGALTAALTGLVVVLAAVGGYLAYTHWRAYNTGLKEAERSSKRYAEEVERLEEVMTDLRREQNLLNEETSRYNLLASQIELTAAMRGYETEEETRMLDYLSIAGDITDLEAEALRYREEHTQNVKEGVQLQKEALDEEISQRWADIRREPLERVGELVSNTGTAHAPMGTMSPEALYQVPGGTGSMMINVNFPNAQFGSPEQARRSSEQAGYILGNEVDQRLNAYRYGNTRP